MKSKQKRLNAAIKQLYQMHQALFGQSYAVGVELNQNSEFNSVIEAFRELIFTIRQTQQQRSKKETINKTSRSPQMVKINYEIRQDITKAEKILTEGLRRLKTEVKSQTEKLKRQKIVKNCYQLLKDVREVEEGGTYKPPSYPTLADIQKNLLGKEYRTSVNEDQINIQEQQAFDRFNKNDKQQDQILDQIIVGNDSIQRKLKLGNQLIDEGSKKIRKGIKKVDQLNERVEKANKDLSQILLTYRRPSQLCLDITLVLMLLALIAVSINLIKGSIGM